MEKCQHAFKFYQYSYQIPSKHVSPLSDIEFGDFAVATSKIEVVDGAPYTLKCRMTSKSAALVYPVSILFDSTAKSKYFLFSLVECEHVN